MSKNLVNKILQVKVKPNSRTTSLVENADNIWIANIKSPPIDGKANEELITLIANHFGCHKSSVEIKSGASSKLKRIIIKTLAAT